MTNKFVAECANCKYSFPRRKLIKVKGYYFCAECAKKQKFKNSDDYKG